VRTASTRKGSGGGQDAALREAQERFDKGDYQGAIAMLDQRQATKGHNRGAELLRGWSNLKMKRFAEARQIFKAEDKKGSTKDTRFGIGATFNSQFNAW
jgi:thioredoxin-like negative regulator of GroEL